MNRPTSYAPIALAAGLMFLLWGAVSAWMVSVLGVILAGIGAARWIRDLRHDN